MGDAACHLGSTCLGCGKFVGDAIAVSGRCPHCGADEFGESDGAADSAPLRSAKSEHEAVDHIIDVWGEDSFPASDPPGSLPPSLDHQSGSTS